MLYGLLDDTSWLYFIHNYVVPLYTYWYYAGPLLLFLVPVVRLSYGSIKYFGKVLLIVCSEVVDFLIETTAPRMMKISEEGSDDDEGNVSNNDNLYQDPQEAVSADRILESIHHTVTTMARYGILALLLILPISFFLSIPFMYYNNHAECYQDYLSHMNNVKECEERGYTAPDFRNLCIRSKKEIQKSVVYCGLQGTMEDLQSSFWSTLCSPFVIVYLCVIVALGLVRSGIKLAKKREDVPLYGWNAASVQKMKNVALYHTPPKEHTLKME